MRPNLNRRRHRRGGDVDEVSSPSLLKALSLLLLSTAVVAWSCLKIFIAVQDFDVQQRRFHEMFVDNSLDSYVDKLASPDSLLIVRSTSDEKSILTFWAFYARLSLLNTELFKS